MNASHSSSIMTVAELVAKFEEICVEMDRRLELHHFARYNKLFKEMMSVADDLRNREPDQRMALVPLYRHRNPEVRFHASAETLKINPTEARAVLQRMSDRNEYPQAADARGLMRGLDDGSFVPK